MAVDEDSGYNNSNRAFLQAFIARSTLTLDEAKPILAAILTAHDRKDTLAEDITEADFNGFISAANSNISPFDLEIRSTFHQTTRQRVYALVNTTSEPITQLATIHTADEINFVKRMLDAMFETYNTQRQEVVAITSMQAMKLSKPPASERRETQNGLHTQGSGGQGLTLIQAERMLKTLVEEGWFEKSRKGYYTLSPRSLMELRGWLMETYNDPGDENDNDVDELVNRVKVCVACKEILTMGQRCSRRTCPCRLHDICTQNFFRAQKSTKCPVCKTPWTSDAYVGERAVTLSNKNKQVRKSALSTRRPSPVADEHSDVNGEENANEEAEEESEEENEEET